MLFTFLAMAKLSLVGEFWYGQITYLENSYSPYEATFLRPLVGVGSRFSPKTNLSLKVGYEQRDYQGDNLSQMSGLIASLSFTHKLNSLFSYEVRGLRQVHETMYPNNTHYFSTGGEVSFFYNPMRILKIGAEIDYLFANYPEESVTAPEDDPANPRLMKREENILSVIPRVKIYPLSWLEVGIGYSIRNRDSNVNGLDYGENRLSASLGAIL